jgi:hypothetical protein
VRPCPLPVPGDLPRGVAEPYRPFPNRPTLPVRSRLSAPVAGWPAGVVYWSAPAPTIPLLTSGMGGRPGPARTPYRGLAPGMLFPLVDTLKPWEGPPRGR